MKLEELIQKRFTEREGLTKFLAKFGDYPAIFSPEAPKDNQDWGTDVHYPRLVYNYDMQADEERKSAGTLSVSLLCQDKKMIRHIPNARMKLHRNFISVHSCNESTLSCIP